MNLRWNTLKDLEKCFLKKKGKEWTQIESPRIQECHLNVKTIHSQNTGEHYPICDSFVHPSRVNCSSLDYKNFQGHSLTMIILDKKISEKLRLLTRSTAFSSSKRSILYGYHFTVDLKLFVKWNTEEKLTCHRLSTRQRILGVGYNFNHRKCDFFNSFFAVRFLPFPGIITNHSFFPH